MPTYEELLQENSELRSRIAEQEQRIEQQGRQIAQLEKIIEELRRGGKRQAAPFSKGEPKSHPQTPGRKPAERYGQRACRPVPGLWLPSAGGLLAGTATTLTSGSPCGGPRAKRWLRQEGPERADSSDLSLGQMNDCHQHSDSQVQAYEPHVSS